MKPSILLFIISCFFSFSAIGGGIEVADQGARASGRGGAFMTRADDLSAIYYNPSGLAKQKGFNLFFNHRLAYSDVEYRRARTLDWSGAVHGVPRMVDFEHVKPEDPLFPLGMMVALSHDFGLKDFSFAAGVYGPPSIGKATYPQDGGQRYMLLKKDILLFYYTLSVAWRVIENLDIGISLQWVDMAKIEIEMVIDGEQTPRSVNPNQSQFDFITNIQGKDRFNFTTILSATYRPSPSLEIAVASRILPINFNNDSRINMQPVNLNMGEEKVLITKNGKDDNRVTFALTMPIKLRAGIRYIYRQGKRELFDLELDIHYDLWSMMDAYTLDAGIVAQVIGQEIKVDKIITHKKWRDTLNVRLGGDYNLIEDRLWLRAGGFFETPAVKKEYAYVDFFSFLRFGPAAGLTVSFNNISISFAYTFVFQMPLKVTEDESAIFQQTPASQCQDPYTDESRCHHKYLGKPSAPANAGVYKANYHFFSSGISLKL